MGVLEYEPDTHNIRECRDGTSGIGFTLSIDFCDVRFGLNILSYAYSKMETYRTRSNFNRPLPTWK